MPCEFPSPCLNRVVGRLPPEQNPTPARALTSTVGAANRGETAALGDEHSAERHLGTADELVADGLGDDVPDWVAYFDAAEHAGARAVSATSPASVATVAPVITSPTRSPYANPASTG